MTTFGSNNSLQLIPIMIWTSIAEIGAMDADAEMFALRYVPSTTSPITDVDWFFGETGDTSGINFRMSIESDSSGAPSGTVLGATTSCITPEFTAAADGFTGLKTFAEDSGNLTVNTPVWIVFYRSSGSSLNGTNYVTLRGCGVAGALLGYTVRHHNGTNWTTTAPHGYRFGFVIKHANGDYVGLPMSAAAGYIAGVTSIYSTNKQGIRFRCGSFVNISGCLIYLGKSASPDDLVMTIYEESTEKATVTIPAAGIISSFATGVIPFWFSSPVKVGPNKNIYIVLSQDGDGGDSTNKYDIYANPISSGDYKLAALGDSNLAFVHGTSTDPTALTVIDTSHYPSMTPLITGLQQFSTGGPLVGQSNLVG